MENNNPEVLLRIEDLCQYFGSTKAVNHVSFDVKKGEVFGLVGESGCGKTTTGRSIIKLYNITSGNIFFKGIRIGAGLMSYRLAIKNARAEYKEKMAAPDADKAALKKELNAIIAEQRKQIKLAKYDQNHCDHAYQQRQMAAVREKYENGTFVKKPVLDKDGNVVEWNEETQSYPGVADFSVATAEHDYYEMNDINNPDIKEDYRRRLFMKLRAVKHPEAMMPTGATMVPRVFKTNVGDIFTTNTIHAAHKGLAVRQLLAPRAADGILEPIDSAEGRDMVWQVVKVYTMPDFQEGVKIMRVK